MNIYVFSNATLVYCVKEYLSEMTNYVYNKNCLQAVD